MQKSFWLALGLVLGLGATASAQQATVSPGSSSSWNLLSFFANPFATADKQPAPVPTQTRPTGFKLTDLFSPFPDVFSKPVMPTTTLPANTQYADPAFLRAWNANYPGQKPF